MFVRCKKAIINMSNKMILHSNFKMKLLYVTAPKTLSTYPCVKLPQNISNTYECSIMDLHRVKTLYPTQQIIKRGYSTENVEEDDSKEEKSMAKITKTLPFLFKFLLASCVDSTVKDQLDHDFITGVKSAFHHVSECLYRKDFEELTDVTTPELLERLKNENISPSVLETLDIKFITLSNLHWEIDRKTSVKKLEVTIQFLFLTKPQDVSDMTIITFAKNLKQGVIDQETVYIASFNFYRKYGKIIKDTPWMLADVNYFPFKHAMRF